MYDERELPAELTLLTRVAYVGLRVRTPKARYDFGAFET